METNHKLRIVTLLLVIAVLGLAQWFFGNLYEAVVTIPNWRVGFEYEALTGRSQFEAGSPIRYYIPYSLLAVVSLWVASVVAWRMASESRRWLGTASAFTLAALLLGIYIITQLNLRLFFGSVSLDVSEAEPLVWQWQWLNYLRLALLSVALFSAASALRLVYQEVIVRSQRQRQGEYDK